MPLYSQSGFGSGKYGVADTGPIYSLSMYYYLGLLTSEYRLSPNLNSWLYDLLSPLNDTTNMITGMTGDFDLDSAEGLQLDVAGMIENVSRTVSFQPSGGISPVLDDETYRILIKATIAANQWDGTEGSLYATWANLFPGGSINIIDNQDMTCTIVLTGSFTSIIQDLIVNGYIVPRPEGVLYNYEFGNLPIFGFSETNTTYIAGWNIGKWAG